MARGFVRGIYVTDAGQSFALQVDADYAAQLERGWSLDPDGALPLLPRQFLPRRVVGIDDAGKQATAVAPTTDAPIWNGTSTVFTFNASDQLEHVATIVTYQEERPSPRARFT